MIGNSEAAAGYVRALELSLAGAAGEVVEPGADLLKAERSGVLHHRYDQTLLTQRSADANVDRRRDGDAVLFPAAVDRGRDRHRIRRGFDDVRRIAELVPARGERCLV